MLEAFIEGFFLLIQPIGLLALICGVLLGGLVGFIPGLNGVVGVALLLPFTFHLNPEIGLPLVIGLVAVTATFDTIPAVLIGTPGTAGSAATIVDGYPMARKGEAGKALGGAFFVSAVGGVFGAILLSVSVPVFKPLVQSFGVSEFLAMTILGLSMVAILTGASPLRGLVAAGLGLLIAMIGMDPINSLGRWTMGTDYLLDGVSVVAVALGLFAVPELIELLARGVSIAREGGDTRIGGKFAGIREAMRHKRLILGSSLLGAWVGFMPGMGTIVANWLAYALALGSAKDKSQFGKGDIRGVLAPEAANNASLGGSLIPTLAFGVPGSAVTALLLATLWLQGVTPGYELLNTNLHLIYLIIWSLAIANIAGALIAYFFTDAFAKLTHAKIEIFAPIVLVLIFGGALLDTNAVGDVMVLVVFGILGWVMKELDWPRPALVLGFVLEPIMERSYFQATLIYGNGWALRPIVLVILAITVVALVIGYGMRIQEARNIKRVQSQQLKEAS